MKRYILLTLGVVIGTIRVFSGSTQSNVYLGDDDLITYIGRTVVQDHSVSYDWIGTTVKITFEGKTLSVLLSNNTPNTYVNVYVDSPLSAYPTEVLNIASVDTFITLYSNKKKGQHTVLLHKRTEGEQGCLTVHEFRTDGTLLPTPHNPRLIEFIGASFTCGYGASLDCTPEEHFTPQTEDHALAFPTIIARYFDADQITIAHSGWGVYRNYNGRFPWTNMVDKYQQTLDLDSTSVWDALTSSIQPAVTVIHLGGNDFSTDKQPQYRVFKENYLKLLHLIKDNYGENHPIICCCAITTDNREELLEYLRQVVRSCGMTNVTLVPLGLHLFGEDELGADKHPNYHAHCKIATTLIPYIATLTGWEMSNKVIE